MNTTEARDIVEIQKEFGPILGHYVNIARVLADMFSPFLETVVHDISDPDESIIAIYNGHLTDRKVGDPATDLVLDLIAGDFPDVLVGYDNRGPEGQALKSSSLAIRNENGELVGVMGLNMDISYFKHFGKYINQIIKTKESKHVQESEHFPRVVPNGVQSPREDIKEAIDNFIISKNWNATMIQNTQKRKIVEHLYKQGYFKTRGAVTIIADELGLTRPSIYNYKNDYIGSQKEQ